MKARDPHELGNQPVAQAHGQAQNDDRRQHRGRRPEPGIGHDSGDNGGQPDHVAQGQVDAAGHEHHGHADHGDGRDCGLLQDHFRVIQGGEVLHEHAGQDDQGQEDGQGDVAANQVEEAVGSDAGPPLGRRRRSLGC